MRPAEDAVVIDTSNLSADGVLQRALGEFQSRLPAFNLLGW